MHLPRHPDPLAALRPPTEGEPWRVLVSGCLLGWGCAVDGSDYGMGGALGDLLDLPLVRAVPFCPEDHGIGTPRTMPDIHGGDGRDVLAGQARVLDERGVDLTEAMLRGARAMLAVALRERIDLAILTDMSAACGSQVISDGCRLTEHRRYRRGFGVATALLLEHRVPVVSQRDHRTLGRLRARIDPSFAPDPAAVDHHETAWYRDYFGA